MLDLTQPVYREALGDGLALRSVANADDVARVAAFNLDIHKEPGLDTLTHHLVMHHPAMQAADMVLVEDETSGRIVSSLCLIPWLWRYQSVTLPSAEMGIVGTLPEYRGRGLIRRQVAYFKQRMRARGCLLSHIQGIPYYYRQFDYEYALPLEGGLRLERRSIPAADKPAFTLRLATLDDLPSLMQYYNQAAQDLAIHAQRDEVTWRYLLNYGQGTATECETWLIEDARGQSAGYMRTPRYHFGEELVVNEVSRLSFDAAMATLQVLAQLSQIRNTPAIRLNLPAQCCLMRLARSLEAYDMGTYAWQIHLPDAGALLQALRPVLESRLADSPFAGQSRDVPLSFYHESITLRFATGKLEDVVASQSNEGGPISIPPLQFIPLALGYRSLEALQAAFPDVRVAPAWRLLVETLFPPVESFIYTIY